MAETGDGCIVLGKLEFVIYLCELNERQPEILMQCVSGWKIGDIFYTHSLAHTHTRTATSCGNW